MKGHTRKRGNSWAFVADAGHHPAARCTTCGSRVWVERGRYPERCTKAACDGVMGEPTPERRQVWRSGFKTKKAAQSALTGFLAAVDGGADPLPAKMTVAEWAKQWSESEAVTGLRHRTSVRYLSILRDDILPAIGQMEVAKVRPRHLNLALEHGKRRGLSPRSVTQVKAVASSMLRAAVDAELIDVNPAAGVRAPKVERAKLVTPTAEEMAALIAQARGTTWEIPILLAATTGMRRSEVLAVTWAGVDLEGARLTVTGGLQRRRDADGTHLEVLDTKTDRSRRTFKIPDITVERLRRWRTEQLERRVALGPAWRDGDLVCDRGDGAPLDPDAMTKAFGRLAKAAGLPPGVRLHDLRHGVATALLRGGVHPAIVSAVLGHSKVAFTLDTYSHVDVGMTGAAADELNRALGGGA